MPADDPHDDRPNELRTTSTSIEILWRIEERDGARVAELADDLGLAPSTVHSHLATLRTNGFVYKESDFYQLGPEIIRLGHYARTRRDGYVLAKQYTRQLSERTGMRSIFVVEQDGRGIFHHTVSGDRANWQHERIGGSLPLHSTAVGKAILAQLPDQSVDEIIDAEGLPKATENTITSRDELYEELDRVRAAGYAVNGGENIRGLWAIGAAAKSPDQTVIGAFSVSGAKHAIRGETRRENLADTLLEVVEDYELTLALS